MSDQIAIQPCGQIHGRIRPPGSKSITNRALICAALADGTSTLEGALDSDDTQVMIESLGRLGIPIEIRDAGQTLVVHGCGGKLPAQEAELFVGNSGTTIRFLTALCTLGGGARGQATYRLDGVARMRERPIGDLLNALNQLGADARGHDDNRLPPVVIQATGLRGGTATVRGHISSQFLSGILMAAPCAQSEVQLKVDGELVSKPYVTMTLRIMEAFGARCDAATDGLSSFRIQAPQTYQPQKFAIEPDASAASYFWGAAAITGGEVTVEGLTKDSLQGDVKFVECLRQMGCRISYEADSVRVSGRAMRGIDVDMNAISDTVQTLAAVALFASGPTTIRGVAHNRHKETDRIGDLARELRKFGADVEELSDGLRIVPPAVNDSFQGATIETYHDHRMAMSLALPGLRIPGVIIKNPGCTAKTYPDFFSDLARLCLRS